MTIVEKVKEILTNCPLMADFADGVSIDFIENVIDTCGMYSNGDSLINKDILGGEHRRHNFVLYAINQPISNYQRLESTNWLLSLQYWLEDIKDIPLISKDTDTEKGKVEALTASNAMLFDIPTGDVKDGVRYQLQLQALYYLNP